MPSLYTSQNSFIHSVSAWIRELVRVRAESIISKAVRKSEEEKQAIEVALRAEGLLAIHPSSEEPGAPRSVTHKVASPEEVV